MKTPQTHEEFREVVEALAEFEELEFTLSSWDAWPDHHEYRVVGRLKGGGVVAGAGDSYAKVLEELRRELA